MRMEVCRLMTLVVAPILLGFGATAGLPKTSDFSWLLARTGERRSLRVEDIPETGTYSIRLRLALTEKAENGSLSFVADGVEFINKGDGVFLRGHDEGLVNAGRMQDPGFQFSLWTDQSALVRRSGRRMRHRTLWLFHLSSRIAFRFIPVRQRCLTA